MLFLYVFLIVVVVIGGYIVYVLKKQNGILNKFRDNPIKLTGKITTWTAKMAVREGVVLGNAQEKVVFSYVDGQRTRLNWAANNPAHEDEVEGYSYPIEFQGVFVSDDGRSIDIKLGGVLYTNYTESGLKSAIVSHQKELPAEVWLNSKDETDYIVYSFLPKNFKEKLVSIALS